MCEPSSRLRSFFIFCRKRKINNRTPRHVTPPFFATGWIISLRRHSITNAQHYPLLFLKQLQPSDPVTLEPSQYKKTLKLLKASKTPKLLDGIKACYDHEFVLEGGALGPLMGTVHGKKAVEVYIDGACAIANFVDPSSEGGGAFSTNGLRLINKKSTTFKGITRIYDLLKRDEGQILANTLRIFYGVSRSLAENGLNVPETDIYTSKLMEAKELLTNLADAVNREIESESATLVASQRYGFRAMHQLLSVGIGNTEASVLLNFVTELIVALRESVGGQGGSNGEEDGGAEAGEPAAAQTVKVPELVVPSSGLSPELFLVSKLAWTQEGQVRIAANGGLECLVSVIDSLSIALESMDLGAEGAEDPPALKAILGNLSWALQAFLRTARACFGSTDERLASLFVAQNNAAPDDNAEEEGEAGLAGTTGKNPFSNVMTRGAKAIAAIWNKLSAKKPDAPQVQTLLKVMGVLSVESVEYSEEIRSVFCTQGCLRSLFLLLGNSRLASSAEKTLTILSTVNNGDRKGAYDERICTGDEDSCWLPAASIFEAFVPAMSDPSKPTLVSRIVRYVSKISSTKENAAAIAEVPELELVAPLLQLVQKCEDGEILPVLQADLEQASIATTTASEPATEESHGGKKKKGKAKKAKKLSPHERAMQREKLVQIGVGTTMGYVYSRGQMVGPEICVYAMRTLGNLCRHDKATAAKLGEEESGGSVVSMLFKLGTSTLGDGLATIYDPVNSRWQEDIVSQINAFKTGRLNKMSKDFSEGIEINVEEAKKEIIGKGLGEKHSTVFLQVEALDALRNFAKSDHSWRQNSLALANAEAEESDSPAAIAEAAASRSENGLGAAVCSVLHNHLGTIYGLLERTDPGAVPADVETFNFVLEKSSQMLGGLIEAKGGRRALLDKLGYSEPTVETEDGEKACFSVNPVCSDALKDIMKGALSLLGGEAPEGTHPIGLPQRLCAVRLISKLCRDSDVPSAKQTLEADLLCQFAIQSGALVQLISLLNPQRVLKDGENYDQGFFDIFKAEIAELVGYFVNRGADREDYYIKPGEEPKSVPPSEADAPIADDERKSRLNFSPFSKQNQCTHAFKMAFVISFSSDLCVNFSLSYLPIP